MSICDCGRDGGLLASNRVLPLSRYRSFALSCRLAVVCFASCGVSSSSLLPCRLVFDTG